jgi:hypothetical protein
VKAKRNAAKKVLHQPIPELVKAEAMPAKHRAAKRNTPSSKEREHVYR